MQAQVVARQGRTRRAPMVIAMALVLGAITITSQVSRLNTLRVTASATGASVQLIALQ